MGGERREGDWAAARTEVMRFEGPMSKKFLRRRKL